VIKTRRKKKRRKTASHVEAHKSCGGEQGKARSLFHTNGKRGIRRLGKGEETPEENKKGESGGDIAKEGKGFS